MRIMRKLVVLTIIGLSTLVVLDNAHANEQIQSEKIAGELTESSVRNWIDSVEYAVAENRWLPDHLRMSAPWTSPGLVDTSKCAR